MPVLTVLAWSAWQWLPQPLPAQWSAGERELIQSLSLSSLPPLPPDPGNRVADSPEATQLGQHLFFDTRLSANGQVSCATCHQPDRLFTDGQARAIGISQVDRNTMGLPGIAYTPWLFWDGRKDSVWSQALEPLENPREHGVNRVYVARLLLSDPHYRERYQTAFGAQAVPLSADAVQDRQRFPEASPMGSDLQQQAWQQMSVADRELINRVFSQAGKALAAWQRRLLPGASAFDQYADALGDDATVQKPGLLNNAAVAGLRLFISKAQCVNCHNGPLFTNNAFHNTGVLSAAGLLPAAGRSEGLRRALADEFNCEGRYSDAAPADCSELRFARGGDEMIGAQRTASLRNLAATAPYMHAGQLPTLAAVIDHYNRAAEALVGHNEAKPLQLRSVEKRQLLAFLMSLNGGIATHPAWLHNPWSARSAPHISTLTETESL